MLSFLKRIAGWNTDDPLDREARTVMESSRDCAAAILRRRAELDRSGHADQPLVVILGERHSRPSHYAHHLALLDQLHAAEPDIAFLTELPHDTASGLLRTKSKNDMAAETARDAVRGRDGNGRLSLKSCLAFQAMPLAHHSTAVLLHALLRRNIPVRFSDISKTSDLKINEQDPTTAESLKACFGKVVSGVATRGRAGMKIRNHHMAQATADFARETGARIILHRCGCNHVMGRVNEGGNHDYDSADSMAAMVRRHGLPVMAMPIVSGSFAREHIPQDHGLAPSEWRAIDKLPETRVDYEGLPDTARQAQEAAYINTLLGRMGLRGDCLSMDQYHNKKEKMKHEVRAIFRALTQTAPPGGDAVQRPPPAADPSPAARRRDRTYDIPA